MTPCHAATAEDDEENVEETAEDLEEKHFRCQSDEERESWLRVLRQARFPRFPFSR